MRLRGILFRIFLLAVWFTASLAYAAEKKMSDYQCGAGGEPTYDSGDELTSYPFAPAFDIHPSRGSCFDNGETLFKDPQNLVHSAACYGTELENNIRTNPYMYSGSSGSQAVATHNPALDPYICGRETRFANLDDYCTYIGQDPPAPGDSYAVRKAKLTACLQVYIPEYAQLADRGNMVMDRNNPSEVVVDTGQKLGSRGNYCYRSFLTEAVDNGGNFEHLNPMLTDAFLKGPIQKIKAPQGNEEEVARVRDACHPWSPRQNYRDTDTTKGSTVSEFFGYQFFCGNWYGLFDYLNRERIDIPIELLNRFDEYRFQLFDFKGFTQFCSKDCPQDDQGKAIAQCQEYKVWLEKFFVARNEACKIIERHYSNTIPPSVLDPLYGGITASSGASANPTIEAESFFAGRWVFEEPNHTNYAPITSDPGTVTRGTDGGPQPKKSKELIFGSAFKDGKDSRFPPFPAPTRPVFGGFSLNNAQAPVISDALAAVTDKTKGKSEELYKAPPDVSKLSVIQGPPGCDQGGSFELMLYQARCMNWFGTTCLCDYDKTFRRGSDLTYVLERAGAKVPLLEEKKQEKKDANGNVTTDADGKPVYEKAVDADGKPILQETTFPWPMVWRGYLNKDYAKRYLKDSPAIVKVGPKGQKGLANALGGSIIMWRDIQGAPKHVAYVERVSWNNELNQCVPAGGATGPPPGTRNYDHVEITEMNNGKLRDICGSTDQWGLVTKRTLYNNKAKFPPLPDGSSSDCLNSDAVTCLETNWENIDVYDPRDTTKNVWGKWDAAPKHENFVKPPTTCNLPKDFDCPYYDAETTDSLCNTDGGKPTFNYTWDEKKEILRRRQEWVWGKVNIATEAGIEDCSEGTTACCAPGSGYRCLIGCDPPVNLRRHVPNEAVPSLSRNTVQGRAPLTGPDAVINMSGRGCPRFPDIYYSRENFSCKRACGADTIINEENVDAPACPRKPGGCPQGLKKPDGCLVPDNGASGGASGGSGGASSSSSGGASGGGGSSNGNSSNGNSSNGNSSNGNSSNGNSSNGNSSNGNSSNGGASSSSGSSGGVTLPQCTERTPASSGASCTGLNCPPKNGCSWTTDRVYSEIFVEALLGGTTTNQVPYLPYVTLSGPSSGGAAVKRVRSPIDWLADENSPLWGKVILGSSRNISTLPPKVGDIAVIIDGRYCVGQAAMISDIPQPGCYVLRSTNWQKGCDIWDDTTCHQSCSATATQSLHTSDDVFQSKPCLSRSDLGPDGYIFRP